MVILAGSPDLASQVDIGQKRFWGFSGLRQQSNVCGFTPVRLHTVIRRLKAPAKLVNNMFEESQGPFKHVSIPTVFF